MKLVKNELTNGCILYMVEGESAQRSRASLKKYGKANGTPHYTRLGLYETLQRKWDRTVPQWILARIYMLYVSDSFVFRNTKITLNLHELCTIQNDSKSMKTTSMFFIRPHHSNFRALDYSIYPDKDNSIKRQFDVIYWINEDILPLYQFFRELRVISIFDFDTLGTLLGCVTFFDNKYDDFDFKKAYLFGASLSVGNYKIFDRFKIKRASYSLYGISIVDVID